MADEKEIETVVLNDKVEEEETVVLDEDLVREIRGDKAVSGDPASRVVRLDRDVDRDTDDDDEGRS